jgi:hypothetical protein
MELLILQAWFTTGTGFEAFRRGRFGDVSCGRFEMRCLSRFLAVIAVALALPAPELPTPPVH